jgi:hypothetical protein
MFTEPLETWEVLLYPLLVIGVVVLRTQPLQLYPAQFFQLEVLASFLLGSWEVWRSRSTRPGLARAVLLGVTMSLSFALFVKGDHRIIYGITLGLMLYLWVLTDGLPTLSWRFTQWLETRRK